MSPIELPQLMEEGWKKTAEKLYSVWQFSNFL
jgi:hypothetical protein